MTHDVLVITCADADRLDAHARALSRLFGEGPPRVLPVLDRRRGNLGGAVDAWAAIRDQVGPNQRIGILHDGGRATRTRAITAGTGGSRGALQLGATHAGHPLDLLGQVARSAGRWASPPGYVDLIWGSQLVLPDGLEPPAGMLCKLARPTAPQTASAVDLAELGWVRAQGPGPGPIRGFAPRGELPGLAELRAWAPPDPSWLGADLGSAALHRDLLDALIPLHAADPRPRDLEPDLTAPWARALAGTPADTPADRELARLRADPRFAAEDALCARPFAGDWLRLRYPAQIHHALTVRVPQTPRLRAAFGLDWPIERTWLGPVWVQGPELTWEQVAAGLTLGGVQVRSAVLRDAALAPGSRATGSWLAQVQGQVDAAQGVALGATDPGVVRGELVVGADRVGPGDPGWGPPP